MPAMNAMRIIFNLVAGTLLMGIYLTAKVSADSVSACFNSTEKKLEFDCGAGNMVQVIREFYGYSPSGDCAFKEGDCTLSEFENYPCAGRESCSINLSSGDYGRKIPSCQQYSTYFQVEYKCVPVSITHDICSTSLLASASGYITTPRYPHNHRGGANCQLTIQTSATQKIKLYILDLDLHGDETGCLDWLYMWDNYRSKTVCGKRGNETFTSFQNKLMLNYTAQNGGSRKGFWLYYEAVPPISDVTTTTTPFTTITPPPSTAMRTTTSSTKTIRTTDTRGTITSKLLSALYTTSEATIKHHISATKEQSRTSNMQPGNNANTGEDLPFAAIVGGIIGSLLFILAVLLALLVKKMRNEKSCEKHDKEHFLEIRNPAFRASCEFRNGEARTSGEFSSRDYYC